MEKTLISIIVPVYNGENHVAVAIDSIANQTVKNFEVICVNDGSLDNTENILNELTNKFKWMRVIKQENRGISGARNTGLAAAIGEYVMFLDADDFLENNAIEVITDRINRYAPEILDFGIGYVWKGNERNLSHHKLPKEQILQREIIENRIIPHLINVRFDPDAFIYNYVWNKVFKKSILDKNKIRFLESRRVWEDRSFLIDYLRYANNYYSIEAYLYNYVSTENSLSRRFTPQYFRIVLENYQLYYKWFYDKYDFTSAYAYEYWSRAIENMIKRALQQMSNKEELKMMLENVLNDKTVILWFKNREVLSERDRRVNDYVLNCNIESLLIMYQKEINVEQRKDKWNQLKYKLRRLL